MHTSVTAVSEVGNKGAVHAVAEYRENPGDLAIAAGLDFQFSATTIANAKRRRRINDLGQVRIRGQWVWPNEMRDGDLRPRLDLDQAELVPADEAVEDRIMETVLKYGEQQLRLPPQSRERPEPDEHRPTRRAPTDPAVRAAGLRLERSPGTTQTAAARRRSGGGRP